MPLPPSRPSIMSEELQRDTMQPPPAPHPSLVSRPPPGHSLVPEGFTNIPGQERGLQYCQPNPFSQHHHLPPASPSVTERESSQHGPFPPSFPPIPLPAVNHHRLSQPPHHFHSQPSPMFSRPPPPVPPRFSQPPQAIPHTPNLPYQAVCQAPPMTAEIESSPMWHQHNPSSVPQVQDPGSNTIPSNNNTPNVGQEDEEDLRWLKEFERRVMSCPSLPSSSLMGSTTTKMDVKVTTLTIPCSL